MPPISAFEVQHYDVRFRSCLTIVYGKRKPSRTHQGKIVKTPGLNFLVGIMTTGFAIKDIFVRFARTKSTLDETAAETISHKPT